LTTLPPLPPLPASLIVHCQTEPERPRYPLPMPCGGPASIAGGAVMRASAGPGSSPQRYSRPSGSGEAYETLGEHLAVSNSPREHGFAVDAFVAANKLAPSKKDGAQTLFQYAALLNRTGDPENAYPLIQRASALDPNRAAIKTLAADIRTKVEHPTKEEITRAHGGRLHGSALRIYRPCR
jgi:hypothetical protein